MPDELPIPVKMRTMAPGQLLAGAGELLRSSSPLPGQMACQRARRLAGAIMLHVVLLCTLLGYRMVRPDEEVRLAERAVPRTRGSSSSGMCGIFPAVPGTGAGSCSRIFLHS